jgi:hypothetical protein
MPRDLQSWREYQAVNMAFGTVASPTLAEEGAIGKAAAKLVTAPCSQLILCEGSSPCTDKAA